MQFHCTRHRYVRLLYFLTNSFDKARETWLLCLLGIRLFMWIEAFPWWKEKNILRIIRGMFFPTRRLIYYSFERKQIEMCSTSLHLEPRRTMHDCWIFDDKQTSSSRRSLCIEINQFLLICSWLSRAIGIKVAYRWLMMREACLSNILLNLRERRMISCSASRENHLLGKLEEEHSLTTNVVIFSETPEWTIYF